MPRRLGPPLIAAGVAAAAVTALLTSSSTPAPVGRGVRAPPFELPRLDDGRRVALSDLRGKVVLLNFWATWCKPCEDEMPAMERLYRQLRSEEFELLAVSVDDDAGDVDEFRRRLQLTFPILLDPDQGVSHTYQTFRYPESLLVGRDGVIVERYVGPKQWDAALYLERIQRLLTDPEGGERA